MNDNEGVAKKPEIIFLNNLRESGVTNMFGAVPYLIEEFPELNRSKAKSILSDWMKNFENYKNIKEEDSWNAVNVEVK